MEVVIPPRDHKPSTYRYTWDDNGEVSRIQRVSETEAEEYNNPNRQTVQWPFQYAPGSEGNTTPSTMFGPRRATWQPPSLRRGPSDASSNPNRDLVPDYVVNYLRGETPETVARRKEKDSSWRKVERDERGAEGRTGGLHMSRAVEYENWFQSNTSLRSPTSSQQHDDCTQMLQSHNEKGRANGWRRLLKGWRGGVVINALISFLILVAGFVCLILAISKASIFQGESVVYAGTCNEAEGINWGLFALINAAVVILLAGANYVSQVLSSPTRAEVAAAHEKGRFLDIGVPSLRNLKYISNTRVFVVLTVLLSAVVTQLIYNSVIFVSQTAVAHDVLFVTESFLASAPFSNGTANNAGGLDRIQLLNLQDRASRNQLVELTTETCFAEFNAEYQTDFDAVVLVTDVVSSTNSLLQTTPVGASLAPFGVNGDNNDMRQLGSQVQYCLVQPTEEQGCAVTLNGSMLGIVALLNLISVVAVAMSLTKTSFEPLVTLGDAIASFVEVPDTTTQGSCLLTKTDAYAGRWAVGEPKYWVPTKHRWFQTPSIPQWFLTILVWLVSFGLAVVGLTTSIMTSPTPATLTPFGKGAAQSALLLPTGTAGIGAAMLSALPHLLLSALYLTTNSLLTTYFLSHELSQFSLFPRTLRVSSSPRGGQTTSLFLTLPRPFSWLLLALFAAMGFVLSQSVFVVHVAFLASSSSDFAARMRLSSPADAAANTSQAAASILVVDEAKPALTALGLSGVGFVMLMALLLILFGIIVGLGFRRPLSPGLSSTGVPMENPLVLRGGSCSAVIAARCQRPYGEECLGTRQGGVQWGVLRATEGMNVGLCGFSGRGVGILEEGRTYA